jgi:hypothetical protein
MNAPYRDSHISLAGFQHYETLHEKMNSTWVSKKEILDIVGLCDGWWIDAIITDWKEAGLVAFETRGRAIYYRLNGIGSIKDLADLGFYVSGYGRRAKKAGD